MVVWRYEKVLTVLVTVRNYQLGAASCKPAGYLSTSVVSDLKAVLTSARKLPSVLSAWAAWSVCEKVLLEAPQPMKKVRTKVVKLLWIEYAPWFRQKVPSVLGFC